MTKAELIRRLDAAERAIIAMDSRIQDLEACNERHLACLKLAAKAQAGLQAQIEALTGAPKPATPKPGGPMLQ